MSTISQAEWKIYIKRMSRLSDKAVEEFRNWVISKGGYSNIARQKLIDYAYALSTKYGEASASLSATAYDAVAAMQKAKVASAVPAEATSYNQVAKTVNGIIKNTGSEDVLTQSVGLMVKAAGQKTTIQNAVRDKAQIAFIPEGDTCVFCMTLAANGWHDASLSDLDKDGEPAHLHANCDCTYGVRFDDSLDYAGYHPEVYEEKYDAIKASLQADGESVKSKDVLNAWRREVYAENSEEINAQKRDAYEKRKERESSAAEEVHL